MPARGFTLTVPSEAPFCDLTATAIRSHLAEAEPGAIEAFTARVREAVTRLAPHGDAVRMVVAGRNEGFDVTLTCGGRDETLSWPITSLS